MLILTCAWKLTWNLTWNSTVYELIHYCVQDENLNILISNFGKTDWKTISSFLPVSTQQKQKSVELCLSFPWTCKCKSLNANQCLHVELSSSWLIKTFPVVLKGADRIPVYAPLEKAPGSWFDKRLLVQRGRWKGGKITPKIWYRLCLNKVCS